jgi:hypothetical protein
MKAHRLCLFIVLLSFVMPACNLGAPAPQDGNAIATSAAQTVEAALTVPAASPTGEAEASPEPGVAIDGTTAEPPTTNDCEDTASILRWERDGKPYDKTEADKPLEPGQAFVMSWIIENTGQCIWDDQYRIMFDSGEQLSPSDSFPAVQPGQTVVPGTEIRVDIPLAAPAKPGTYETSFSLVSPEGRSALYFGIITTVGGPVNASLPAPGDLRYTYDCTTGSVNITLTWKDKAKDEAGYRVYRDGVRLAELPADTTTYSDIAPASGSYQYVVAAYNAGGEAPSRVQAETSNCQ